jgi:hypothetical protein
VPEGVLSSWQTPHSREGHEITECLGLKSRRGKSSYAEILKSRPIAEGGKVGLAIRQAVACLLDI